MNKVLTQLCSEKKPIRTKKNDDCKSLAAPNRKMTLLSTFETDLNPVGFWLVGLSRRHAAKCLPSVLVWFPLSIGSPLIHSTHLCFLL